MLRHRWSYSLVGCLLTPLCIAGTVQIDPRGESLYQQALPYLQQADSKLEAVQPNMSTLNAEEQQSLHLIEEAGALIQPAMALLEKAAVYDHPVALYRLGLIYLQIYPTGQAQQEACPLFEKSLARGFAPPAVPIASWCIPYTDRTEYQLALHAVEAVMPIYEKYFPQPGWTLECKPEATGMALSWGSSHDYQAEVYRLLGSTDRSRRAEYYQKAIDVNGCLRAKRWMEAMNR